jgi:hypothetical protein
MTVNFGYLKDRKITDVLVEKPFTLSAEMIPPRNGEPSDKTVGRLQQVVDSGVDFLSVTKGAGGSLRGAAYPLLRPLRTSLKSLVLLILHVVTSPLRMWKTNSLITIILVSAIY